jgi:hypothetical protein
MRTTKNRALLISTAILFCVILPITGLAQDTPSGAIPSSTKSAADKEEKAETDVLQRHYPFYVAYGHEVTKL